MEFKLTSKYKPTGDQPEAIKELADGIRRGDKSQVLLGVTGPQDVHRCQRYCRGQQAHPYLKP